MSRSKYTWKLDEPPPSIEPHSRNKHSLYGGYLRRYIRKLTQNPRHPSFRLFIVDGFCGGGVYWDENNHEHLGSPFIVFSAVSEELADVAANRENPVTAYLQYYFIDSDRSAIEYLEQAHQSRGINQETKYPVRYLCQKFDLAYQDIITAIKQCAPRTQRVLFILDQYGWSGVPFSIINDVFRRLSDAEIILTFTPDEIIDHIGSDPQKMREVTKTFQAIGFGIEPQEIFGAMGDNTNGWQKRLAAQELLTSEIKAKLTATYFTRYYLRRPNSHRAVMLIHLSQHPVAHNEMMEEHWSNSNMYIDHQGYAGISPLMLGYDYKYAGNFLHFEEDFFKKREDMVVNAMMQQIPIILHAHPVGLPFSALMKKLINDSPVTVNIVKKVVKDLIQHKEVEVISSKTGRKSTAVVDLNDQIKLPSQCTITYINGQAVKN